MIPYRHRFHGYNALRFVTRQGVAVRGRMITVKYTLNPRRSSSRFSVVVSKKIYKRAVQRNLVRRRVYEIIRRELPYLQEKHDVMIIVTNRETISLSHEELKSEIVVGFTQANLY